MGIYDDSPDGNKIDIAFLESEEGDEWQAFVEAMSRIGDEQDRADLPLGFLRRVLPEIASSPTMFDAMKEAWNRVCDEQGEPHRKFTLPEPGEGEDRF